MASDKTGAFHDEAMAIVDLPERILFLNRRQSWVVQTLTETLPRVRDDELRSDLAAMLRTHEANIGRANDVAGLVLKASRVVLIRPALLAAWQPKVSTNRCHAFCMSMLLVRVDRNSGRASFRHNRLPRFQSLETRGC